VRKLTQLWQTLERIPRFKTTTPYWKRYCGFDYEVIRPFLHATDFSGGTYPCAATEREGCYREIVECGGKIVAVCREQWNPCEEVPLNVDDNVLYELDLRSFTGAIAAALGVRWQRPEHDPQGPWVMGLLSDGTESDRTVFLIIETNRPRFLDSVLRAIVHSDGRKVILAPTNRFKDAEIQKLLGQHQVSIYPLEQLILAREDGTLGSPNTIADLLSGKMTPTVGGSQGDRIRGKGFDANASDHRKVAMAAAPFGNDLMPHLRELCVELQRVGADVPSSVRDGEFLETWTEIAAEVEGSKNSTIREKISAYIRYRLNWVRKHPPDSQVE
jgi:hypothetical protein